MLTAIGLKRGGTSLAYLTTLMWISPAIFIMTLAAFGMTYLQNKAILHFVLPVGVGLILQSGWVMAKKVINGPLYVLILLLTIFLWLLFWVALFHPLITNYSQDRTSIRW